MVVAIEHLEGIHSDQFEPCDIGQHVAVIGRKGCLYAGYGNHRLLRFYLRNDNRNIAAAQRQQAHQADAGFE